jgi:hypothetical protein
MKIPGSARPGDTIIALNTGLTDAELRKHFRLPARWPVGRGLNIVWWVVPPKPKKKRKGPGR